MSNKKYELNEDQVVEIMAESGKSKVSELMKYLKAKYNGKYDPKLAKENAIRITSNIN